MIQYTAKGRSATPMINWHHIETVLLDMDGTLLDLHFDNYFWLTYLPIRYAEIHELDVDTARDQLHQHIRHFEGTLKWYCLDHWSELLSVDIAGLKTEISHKIAIRPFVIDFLKRLRRLNKRVVLVTNAHPQGLSLKLDITEIDQWLDLVISSHDLQHPKEAQAFWVQLQQHEAFDPQSTLFIDDTVRVLQSAQDFGIRHLLCINQPDSQQANRHIVEFPTISHFDEIMPPPP